MAGPQLLAARGAEKGALGTERSVKTSPHPSGRWHRNCRRLGLRASITVAQGGLSSLIGSVLPSQDNRPHNGALSPGWAGKHCPHARLPTRPPARSQGPHCVAAAVGSRWLPGPTGGGPAASRASGGGHRGHQWGGGMGGPGWARVRHTQSRGCGMKGPILPGLALPSRPGQHVVRWSSPHHRPQASAWPRPGQCLGLETQSWF